MIYNLVIDSATKQPTEAGLVWMRQAGVDPEDLMILGNDNQKMLSPTRQRVAQNLPSQFPGINSHISRTLALLKVAQIIVREKYEKSITAVKVSYALNIDTNVKPLSLVNAKFGTRS